MRAVPIRGANHDNRHHARQVHAARQALLADQARLSQRKGRSEVPLVLLPHPSGKPGRDRPLRQRLIIPRRPEIESPTFGGVQTGFEFAPVVQSYAQAVIDKYALGSLDMNPVHTNTDWAARAQIFGLPETVGHGMMTMSSLASVVTRQWGVASANGGILRFVEAKFTKPVKVGETVVASAKLKSKHHHGPGKNWVRISVEARDSSGEVVALADVGYGLPD